MSSAFSSFRSRDHALFLLVLSLLSLARLFVAVQGSGRRLMESHHNGDLVTYRNDAVLSGGDIPVSVLWYGRFSPAKKAIVTDFLLSLSAAAPEPSVSTWWSAIDRVHRSGEAVDKTARVVLAGQVSDEGCSLGKRLELSQLPALAAMARPAKASGVALVLTAEDVAVEGFCVTRCGAHGSADARSTRAAAYAWVGNPGTQCPGLCARPFLHQPQAPALVVPPNGDAGMDGVVTNVASALVAAVTDPVGEGDRAAPLDAAGKACPGAYPGYAGELLVDEATGARYNANGAHGRKYLLPAMFDPDTSSCNTLV
ncbi:hypothetical protein EJB05_05482, partial [Eragrostis curvula]